MYLKDILKKYNVKRGDCLIRYDGRVEWVCKHGIHHTIYAPDGVSYNHKCDGCCKYIKRKESD